MFFLLFLKQNKYTKKLLCTANNTSVLDYCTNFCEHNCNAKVLEFQIKFLYKTSTLNQQSVRYLKFPMQFHALLPSF